MLRTLIVTTGLLGLAAFPAHAADASDTVEAEAVHPHTAAMMKLEPLKGEFDVSGTRNEMDGSVSTFNVSRTSGREMVNGVGVEQDFVTDTGNGRPITNRVTFSYDQYREIYRVSVLDDSSGLMDIYEGTIEDGVLSTTNVRSGTTYMSGETEVHFRMDWDLNDPIVEFDVYGSANGGDVWQPYMMIVLTPIDTD